MLVKGTFFPQNDVILFKTTSTTHQKKDACFYYLCHQVVLGQTRKMLGFVSE